MNSFGADDISTNLKSFLDHNTSSDQLGSWLFNQFCQSLQCFPVSKEIINQKNLISFSKKFSGNDNIINSSVCEWFYLCCIYIPCNILCLCLLCKYNRYIKYFSRNTCDSDPRSFDRKNLRNLLMNSFPISWNSFTSIWWLRKLSTFKTLPSFIFPSLRILSFNNCILAASTYFSKRYPIL